MKSNKRTITTLLSILFLTLALVVNGRASGNFTEDQLVVNFLSTGSGIDHKAKAKFQAYVKKFQKENIHKPNLTIEPWGKEGETKYIFDLSPLSVKEKDSFKKTITEMFKGNKRISVES
ncbi:MAG: hypothetical protein HOP08_18150 [Cyclobacteriaceae bacterium]|nr:hypothetical protein [Cyclobacteriaceae bacterium]